MEYNVIITKQSSPLIFECLETISHDRGSGAGHEEYAVPGVWAWSLPEIEKALSFLSDEEREILSIGDYDEAQSLVSTHYPRLSKADEFLGAFFNDFEPQEEK